MKNFLKIIKNKEAISDIIGNILLIALIVAVFAVTALFFFGYMQIINKPYLIEITASRLDPNTIEIMNRGGQDIDKLDISNGNPFTVTIGGVVSTPASGSFNENIGSIGKFNASPGSHIIITGVFKDNSTHILYDSFI
jgi:hypothetical protein